MLTTKQQEALDLMERFDTQKEAAAFLGIGTSAFCDRLKAAMSWENVDPSIQKAAAELGIEDMRIVKGGWLKNKNASFRIDLAKNEDVKNFLATVNEAFVNLRPRKPIKPPKATESNLCTFYNIIDHHLAMHSWGKETGEDYDLQIGIDRLTDCMGKLVMSTPKSGTAVVLNLGDFYHADNSDNETPQHKHNLDVDGRYLKVISAGVAVTVACIDMALEKHKHVTYRALRGNHDPHAHVALTVALSQHYRNCDRVTVEFSATDFFIFEWGRNMVMGHHGDKAKPDRLVMFMADNYAEIWGRTHWRFLWTGHVHHDSSKDIGGALWESFRTLAPKDAFAASNAYSARQTMQAITLDKDHGEIIRNKVQIIPPRFR